jgi:penicillin-binding protein 1C
MLLENIPLALQQATLAAEDRRFRWHGGVDPLAIARALWDNLKAGRVVSGASTIHQQLIKITSSKPASRTLVVKIREAWLARRLAMAWSRDRVLQEYLNRLPYGNLQTGCVAAAAGYFDKPLADLSVAECALLAAIPQSPTRLNPYRNLEALRARQRRILDAMLAQRWITEEQHRAACAEAPALRRYTGGFAAPHAVEMLRGRPSGVPPEEPIVRTTLDAALQRQVERIIADRLATLTDRHVSHAAAVVIENSTGHVLALAGSRDFFAKDSGQINGAWTPHSPGSAIKPLTYELAFERGYTPASILADLPVEYPTPTGIYRPENYAHRLYGPVTCRDALGNSLNIASVRLLNAIGGAEVLLQRLWEMGMTNLIEPPEHYGLGLTLGNAPVRLLELANAYACLARLGIWQPWRLVLGSASEPANPVLQKEACYLIADILSDNQARQLTFGLNSPLRLPFRAAVKTGTSQSYRDNWTLGYTPDHTVGVWVGNFDNTPMQEVSGVTGAAPIWRDIMLHLYQHRRPRWYPELPGIVRTRIDPRTGRRLTAQSPPVRLSREELFSAQNLPPMAQAQDYDAQGRALLPPEYARWVRSAENRLGDLVACAETASKDDTWTVSNPVPGTVVHLDSDLPGGGRRLLLETSPAPSGITWQCPTLPVQVDGGQSFVLLTPGEHRFTAKDKKGRIQHTHVIVRPED